MASVTTEIVQVEKPENINFIFGQSHFIKTVEDIYEAIVQTGTAIKFGIAFCEASGPRLIRFDGNDDKLIELAKTNAMKVGCGHTFFVFIDNGFPINILNPIKNVTEVVRIYAATSNPLQVIVAKTEQGRGVMGVIDGQSPLGFEGETEKQQRKDFLRMIGYKK
eukprot:CAMPEP_0168547178 /NCGR_PEP_ID=MMETSP0413-20121227/3896_1 /TAXON_ID=136452 /ORGANISM="Filamoeba nolandi, Strain NC-AS-23-1" /LENGTH=163 /DNA_ID=CAMNT_0008577411 /DNA_START=13 /DNA_END=504 /DNA_ORIENTATION=-